MNIAFVSCNLGSIDLNMQSLHVLQSVKTDFYYFTEENFPLRDTSMCPRLQAKLPKMLAWDMIPEYDLYIWADSCITLSKENSISWMIEQLADKDIAFFRHQDGRNSLKEELDFMENHMNGNSGDKYAMDYLNERYATEPIQEQVKRYLSDVSFIDDKLYSAGMFIYRNSKEVQETLKEWFYHCSRFSIQDQLSLPYVLQKSNLKVKCIDEGITNNNWTKYWNRRNRTDGKWDTIYSTLSETPSAFLYGDTSSYEMGAKILEDCKTVEDWGVGAGGFKRYRPDAIGVDGSHTPYADIISSLVTYTSNVDGIFMRHVLEHNFEWKQILINALKSATKKIALIIFTPFIEEKTSLVPGAEEENKSYGIDVPTLFLNKKEVFDIITSYCTKIYVETISSETRYGQETIITIEK
jgi:hypothetical protein